MTIHVVNILTVDKKTAKRKKSNEKKCFPNIIQMKLFDFSQTPISQFKLNLIKCISQMNSKQSLK